MDFIKIFREKMHADGMTITEEIIPDGKIHRVHIDGDSRGSLSGWYVFHGSEMPGGAYGCWKRGLNRSWCSKTKNRMTPNERIIHSNRISATREARHKAHGSAKEKTLMIWNKAKKANSEHPYLINKNVKSFNLKTTKNNALIIPITDQNGEMHSLQFISAKGDKKFLSGGKISGNFFPIGSLENPTDKIYIAEGYATCMTIHEAINCFVVCAFNCTNLLPVSQIIKEKFPEAEIIIAADNDTYTPQNPGITKGKEAASCINAELVYPDFKGIELQSKPTDFNDLMLLSGLDAVKRALNKRNESTVFFNPYESFADTLPPVEQVPYEALPDTMASFIKEHSLIRGCSPDYILVSLLARMGCVFAGKIKLALTRNTSWTCSPNFFWMMIGNPSSGKSNAFSLTDKPIKLLESTARETFKQEIKKHKEELEILERKLNAVYKGLEQECKKKNKDENTIFKFEETIKSLKEKINKLEESKPKLKRYIVQKITLEKLILILEENPDGIMLELDELSSTFIRFSKDEHGEERTLFLSGYNGNIPYSYDTIKRGTVLIPDLLLSILGGTQPAKLKRFLKEAKNGQQDDGLLQRFQGVAFPDRQLMLPKDKPSNDLLTNIFNHVFSNLNNLSANTVFHFDNDAQEIFDAWREKTTIQAYQHDYPLDAHVGKSYEFVAALSLYLCLYDNDGKPPSENTISKKYVLSAIKLGKYFLSHAKRMYSLAYEDSMPARSLAKKLAKLCTSPDQSPKHYNSKLKLFFFTRSQIRGKDWSDLTTKELRKEAIEKLIQIGHISQQIEGKHYINPKHLLD